MSEGKGRAGKIHSWRREAARGTCMAGYAIVDTKMRLKGPKGSQDRPILPQETHTTIALRCRPRPCWRTFLHLRCLLNLEKRLLSGL